GPPGRAGRPPRPGPVRAAAPVLQDIRRLGRHTAGLPGQGLRRAVGAPERSRPGREPRARAPVGPRRRRPLRRSAPCRPGPRRGGRRLGAGRADAVRALRPAPVERAAGHRGGAGSLSRFPQPEVTAFDVCGPLPEPGVTVLEASAGTGKTFTIAALAARYVAGGIPLHELLVVTFTRMATGELRDRVRERLVSAVQGLVRVVAGELAPA